MNILYAIQGTGNGHLSRARDIIPALQKKGNVDILISGTQADVDLPYPVTYQFKGLSFIFGKKGGVDILETYKKANFKRLFKEINSLPVEKYDFIINDFEPVSAWACYIKNKACISLSHQSAVLHKKAPQPKHVDLLGRAVLKNYAPSTTQYGFHFHAYDKNIFTPVIRNEVREMKLQNKKHYTVYLPSYDNERIRKVLGDFKNVQWQVFSKHNKKFVREKNIFIFPINNADFITSLATCEGVLCGAGFETPAEALFMQKKLLVIPMKGQYEQHCNAAALKQMGVQVIKSLKTKHADKIKAWIESDKKITVYYPNITESIVNTIFQEVVVNKKPILLGKKISSPKKLREMSLQKIFAQLKS